VGIPVSWEALYLPQVGNTKYLECKLRADFTLGKPNWFNNVTRWQY